MDIFGLSLNLNIMITYFINTIIAWIAVIITDNIIAHNVEGKKAFALAFASFFLVPLLLPLLGIGALGSVILVSAIVWIGLGELILEADWTTKLKVLVVAFIVYFAISFFLGEYIYGLTSIFV